MQRTRDELKNIIEQLERLELQFEAQSLTDDILYKIRRVLHRARELLTHVEELLK